MIKSIIVLAAVLAVLTTGCMNNGDQQVRQQGARMNQTQNQGALNKVQIANQAADRIVQVPGVKQANVLVTRQNAYVAAVVDTNQGQKGQISRQLEDQIAQKVRQTDRSIMNVYVSTNPEFVDRVNKYIADMGQGRPVTGFLEEFNEMVQRMFPNAR